QRRRTVTRGRKIPGWKRVAGTILCEVSGRTPLGVFAIVITTVSITLMLIGMGAELLGFFKNPYVGIFIYMILPGGMVLGLLLIPVAAYLRRRQWRKTGITKDHLQLDLSNPKHRLFLVGFVILTVTNMVILGVVGYEGYHFTDSPYFCGMVCHKVMAPEYTAYQRSPHGRVSCVECHIGPGAEWFVRAKLSGLRQVYAVLTNSYSRPIPSPVEALRPARDTCEECHWPEKFYGKKVKEFIRYSDADQITPEKTEISLHIGGHNPMTGAFEGIHWHVSKDVEVQYMAANEKRTSIARVKVTRPDGSTDEFVNSDIKIEDGYVAKWRTMDCIDCHNRPTHIMDMPEDVVDFGLLSKKINPDIQGIREDSLTAIEVSYASQDDARENLVNNLMELQRNRNPLQAAKYEGDIKKAGAYLLGRYLGNVWPDMKVAWGTYKTHLGHQYADEGYGCWRCHDDEHENKEGETISQDCSLCHDEPE
ncbi:MAG: NapC/NirT family cytochrome c, partial [Desulfobulbaceae bacterium]|nr:NapC/NirT family cytochrome c [Desulfobulbaceae bacterium]